jgi:hypothetical protein
MKETKIYAQSVAVLTRVNNCENKIWLIIHTYKPLTDKPTRKKVFNFLMKEFGVEGMYGMSINNEFCRVYDIESIRHYDFTDSYYRYLIE